MSHAHNVLIRGLNSVYLQAPHVRSPQDIGDFLFFCQAWVKTVEHHHDTEENTLFPALEKFTEKPGIMEGNMQQHQAFLPALHDFAQYAQNTSAGSYSSDTLKGLVDGFAPPLLAHLREEIDTLLGLDGYDSAELMKVWIVTENVAKGAAHPNQFVSLPRNSAEIIAASGPHLQATNDACTPGYNHSMRIGLR